MKQHWQVTWELTRLSYQRVLNHFYWPKLCQDLVEFCRSCHVHQLIWKPNQNIQYAPLIPISAFEEPFSQVIINCEALYQRQGVVTSI